MRTDIGEGGLGVREASDDDAAQIQREKSWHAPVDHAVRESVNRALGQKQGWNRESKERG